MTDTEPAVVRATVAGAVGGAVAAVALLVVAAVLIGRFAPKLMPGMMARMMREGGCSEQMRACMERCGCGGADQDVQAREGSV